MKQKDRGHGGKRQNAGRKSLAKIDRLVIACRVANELRTPGRQLPGNPKVPWGEVRQSQDVLAGVPVIVAGKDERRRELTPDEKEHQEWLQGELDPKPCHKKGHRVIFAEKKKLAEICAQVADDESRRRGVHISPRQVRRWYEDLYPKG